MENTNQIQTETNVDNEPNALLVHKNCPVCKQDVPMDNTAVYSRSVRAFLHLDCRDAVVARQSRRKTLLKLV